MVHNDSNSYRKFLVHDFIVRLKTINSNKYVSQLTTKNHQQSQYVNNAQFNTKNHQQ